MPNRKKACPNQIITVEQIFFKTQTCLSFSGLLIKCLHVYIDLKIIDFL